MYEQQHWIQSKIIFDYLWVNISHTKSYSKSKGTSDYEIAVGNDGKRKINGTFTTLNTQTIKLHAKFDYFYFLTNVKINYFLPLLEAR